MHPRTERLGRMVIIAMAVTNLVGLFHFSRISINYSSYVIPQEIRNKLLEELLQDPRLLQYAAMRDHPANTVARATAQQSGNESPATNMEALKEEAPTPERKAEEVPSQPIEVKPETQKSKESVATQENKESLSPKLQNHEQFYKQAKERSSQEANKQENAAGEDEMVEFTFQSRRNTTYRARPLRITRRQLAHLALQRPAPLAVPDTLTIDDFVFVTAASKGFFNRLKDEVGNIHEYGMKNKIIVYDIGLPEDWAQQVKTWCNVEYRKFDFDLYPEHVRSLKTYSWKSIMMAEVLKEHDGIIWWDSSIRFKEKPKFERMLTMLRKTGGGLSLSTSGTTVFYATYPTMFEYLPSNVTALQSEHMRESTFIFYRTQLMMDNVIKWMVLCALNQPCIAPTEAKLDCWGGNSIPWGHCHRYDQSVVNILMLDLIGNTRNFFEGGFVAGVYRNRVGVHNVTICT